MEIFNRSTLLLAVLLSAASMLVSCGEDDDVPDQEPEEEVITDVTLTFTSETGEIVVVTAQDPDGEGPQDIQASGTIVLAPTAEYVLSIDLQNSIEGESITEEIQEEAEEHMFFFGFTDNLFSDPNFDGNIDNRSDDINYNDVDANGLPLGLSTTWTTEAAGSGIFRVVLKHQPEIKSISSTADDGESDIDLTWDIQISE